MSGQGSLFRRSAIDRRARDSLGRARRAHSRGAGRGMGHRGAALGLGTAHNRARATATSRQRAAPRCARVGDHTARARRCSARRRVTAPVDSEAGRRRVRRARYLAVDARVTRARDPDKVRPRESDRPRAGQSAPGRGRRDRFHDRSGPAAPLSDRESSRLRGHARRCDRRSATASCRGHAGERNRPRLTRRTCPGALLPAGRACACRGCPDRRRVPRLPVPTRGDRSAAGQDPARADPARECERARIRPIGAARVLPAGAGNRRRVCPDGVASPRIRVRRARGTGGDRGGCARRRPRRRGSAPQHHVGP